MSIEAWITLWEWVFLIGVGAFVVLVIAIIPLGARDMAALFRHLNRDPEQESDQ